LETVPDNLLIEDRWIIDEFNEMVVKVNTAWQDIDIYTAGQCIKNFSTGVFPSHWLEMVKGRLYDGDKVAAWTIHRIVRDILAMFSPICPLFSHHISTTLYQSSAVDVRNHPKSIVISSEGITTDTTHQIIEFNSMVWKEKQDAGSSLADPISGIEVPENLILFADVLTSMHKLNL